MGRVSPLPRALRKLSFRVQSRKNSCSGCRARNCCSVDVKNRPATFCRIGRTSSTSTPTGASDTAQAPQGPEWDRLNCTPG